MLKKQAGLEHLVQRRRGNVWAGYFSIAHFHDGIYECEHVSPYTKSAGNLNATVFVMLQDWASSDCFKDGISHDSVRYGHEVARATNSNLKDLLLRHFGLKLSQTYGTNLFPFIKPGPMSTHIPQTLMRRAAIEYGLPQMDIIEPKLVICLGKDTFNAVRLAVGIRKVATVEQGIALPFKYGKTAIWLQAHTGQLGKNNRNKGGVDRVSADWETMARSMKRGELAAATQE